jgi:hypothetical protein
MENLMDWTFNEENRKHIIQQAGRKVQTKWDDGNEQNQLQGKGRDLETFFWQTPLPPVEVPVCSLLPSPKQRLKQPAAYIYDYTCRLRVTV